MNQKLQKEELKTKIKELLKKITEKSNARDFHLEEGKKLSKEIEELLEEVRKLVEELKKIVK